MGVVTPHVGQGGLPQSRASLQQALLRVGALLGVGDAGDMRGRLSLWQSVNQPAAIVGGCCHGHGPMRRRLHCCTKKSQHGWPQAFHSMTKSVKRTEAPDQQCLQTFWLCTDQQTDEEIHDQPRCMYAVGQCASQGTTAASKQSIAGSNPPWERECNRRLEHHQDSIAMTEHAERPRRHEPLTEVLS